MVDFAAITDEALVEKLQEYLLRDSVRMLKPDFESNGYHDVPLREPLTDELLAGTAAIYQGKAAIGPD